MRDGCRSLKAVEAHEGESVQRRFLLLPAILLLMAPVVSADSLDVLKGDSTWRPFQTPTTVGGTAHWNNSSFDEGDNHQHECNIGYWLSGTGGCGTAFNTPSPRITPNSLGDATTGFLFTKAAGTLSVTVTSHLQVSAYKDTDEFGWFDLSAPSVLNALFRATNIAGSGATFVPSGSYGFYLKSPEGTYLSTGVGDTRSHFAVFQLAGNDHYMIGAEDMWNWADRDFNDLAYDIKVNGDNTNVPEPATIVLLGSGLVGIGAAVRRRRTR